MSVTHQNIPTACWPTGVLRTSNRTSPSNFPSRESFRDHIPPPGRPPPKCKPISSFACLSSTHGTVQLPVSTPSDLRRRSLSLLLLIAFRFIAPIDYCFPAVKEFCSVQTVSLRLLRYPGYRAHQV
jgi:hypothetical protein